MIWPQKIITMFPNYKPANCDNLIPTLSMIAALCPGPLSLLAQTTTYAPTSTGNTVDTRRPKEPLRKSPRGWVRNISLNQLFLLFLLWNTMFRRNTKTHLGVIFVWDLYGIHLKVPTEPPNHSSRIIEFSVGQFSCNQIFDHEIPWIYFPVFRIERKQLGLIQQFPNPPQLSHFWRFQVFLKIGWAKTRNKLIQEIRLRTVLLVGRHTGWRRGRTRLRRCRLCGTKSVFFNGKSIFVVFNENSISFNIFEIMAHITDKF